MRRWLLASMMVGAAQGAYAADMPDFLRGGFSPSAPTMNWSGAYIGGQVTYGSGDMDFGQSTQALLERLLNHTTFENNTDTSGKPANDTRVSAWQILHNTTNRSAGVGGFGGYNWQWGDVVGGLELNYVHGKFTGASQGEQAEFSNSWATGYITNVDVLGRASMVVNDFGSVRVRGGYAMGNFLPYGFVGLALGQADESQSVTANIRYTPATTPPTVPVIPGISTTSLSSGGSSQFIYGYAAGLGFDYMVCANIFVRGEWEYIHFLSPTADTTINTVRAGVGYKF